MQVEEWQVILTPDNTSIGAAESSAQLDKAVPLGFVHAEDAAAKPGTPDKDAAGCIAMVSSMMQACSAAKQGPYVCWL